MEAIYTRYTQRETSFVNTLALLQDLLNERLLPDWKRVIVQGSNSGRTRFCFIIYPRRGNYTMRFLDAGSFRQFRSDGDLNSEIALIEQFLQRLANTTLNGVI